MKKGKTRNVSVLNITFILVALIGIGIMFYPSVSNFFYKLTANNVIENYSKDFASVSSDEKNKMISDARNYNENNLEYKIEDVFETDINAKDKMYDNLLNLNNDGVMGYIDIPKISVKLPIYHGTSDEVLNKGVGHLKGTSLPVGGESTHAVLAAHRGLPSAKLFTDLNLVKKNDKFYIIIADEVLTYSVDKIDVIEPQEIDVLQIEKDSDYVTLVTCTPYAINSHRLLVRGKRVQNDLTKTEIEKHRNLDYTPLITVIIAMIITGGLMVYINHKYSDK